MIQSESSFALDSEDNFYLTEVSAKDKAWDKHRGEVDQVRDLYLGTDLDRNAERMNLCSRLLSFGLITDPEKFESQLKLRTAMFCHVRHCPVCQWRKSLVWVAKFFKAVPKIREQYPTAKFIFLTLTVKNPHVSELRSTLRHMNKSWQRLSERKAFPAIGWLKSVEVTREYSCSSAVCSYKSQGERCIECQPTDYAHPHFHAVLMVKPSYFGDGYLSQREWRTMWQKSLRVDYEPSVSIRAVKAKIEPNGDTSRDGMEQKLRDAFRETLKYSVKPSDLISGQDWLLEITKQLHGMRSVAVGGAFREFMTDEEPTDEDMINPEKEVEDASLLEEFLLFGWKEKKKRYSRIKVQIEE